MKVDATAYPHEVLPGTPAQIEVLLTRVETERRATVTLYAAGPKETATDGSGDQNIQFPMLTIADEGFAQFSITGFTGFEPDYVASARQQIRRPYAR